MKKHKISVNYDLYIINQIIHPLELKILDKMLNGINISVITLKKYKYSIKNANKYLKIMNIKE